MNRYQISLLSMFLCMVLSLTGLTCHTNKTNTDSTAKQNSSQEEIVIKVDNNLKKDISDRLQPFIEDNVVPITIDDRATAPDITISLTRDKVPDNYLLYEKQLSLSPTLIKDNLSSKIYTIYIGLSSTNDTLLTEQIKTYLQKSFTSNPPQENTLVFAGDILLSRWVAKISDDHSDSLYCFSKTADITKNADLTIANLEAPFAETGPYTNLGVVFRADPKLVAGLVYGGYDILNLANNHFGDSGQAGMKFTFKTLTDNNINYYGAGDNASTARTPVIKEINGVKYAFLGYTDSAFTPTAYEADDIYAGVNLMNIDNLKVDLEKAKQQADFVIVTMNSGVEYDHNPDQTQIDFAHTAIDNGADMIFGLHPHVVQAIEYYQGKPIFYNIGNFIMDQLEKDTQQGYIISLSTIYNQISSIELLPYHIYDYCQPNFTQGDETTEIITEIINANLHLSNP